MSLRPYRAMGPQRYRNGALTIFVGVMRLPPQGGSAPRPWSSNTLSHWVLSVCLCLRALESLTGRCISDRGGRRTGSAARCICHLALPERRSAPCGSESRHDRPELWLHRRPDFTLKESCNVAARRKCGSLCRCRSPRARDSIDKEGVGEPIAKSTLTRASEENPRASAPAFVTSMHLPPTYGPRSVIAIIADLALFLLVTLTVDPNGRDLCAAVSALSSSGMPDAVCTPCCELSLVE